MRHPKENRRQRGGEELLGIIGESIDATLKKHGIAPHIGTVAAIDVAAQVRFRLGRTTIYIPAGRPDADETAADVYGRWQAGQSVDEIAAELEFTTVYIYRLLGRERARLQSIRDAQLKNRMNSK